MVRCAREEDGERAALVAVIVPGGSVLGAGRG